MNARRIVGIEMVGCDLKTVCHGLFGIFGEDSIEAIGRDIRQKKAVALIIANADITEVEQ